MTFPLMHRYFSSHRREISEERYASIRAVPEGSDTRSTESELNSLSETNEAPSGNSIYLHSDQSSKTPSMNTRLKSSYKHQHYRGLSSVIPVVPSSIPTIQLSITKSAIVIKKKSDIDAAPA